MNRKSGHLYTTSIEGYKQIGEKGLLYPSELMIVAGALEENRGEPHPLCLTVKFRELPQQSPLEYP